jgi:hypothetical protein
MSQKAAKLLRKFCKSTGFQYGKTKKVFKTYDRIKKAWMFEEMRKGVQNV